MRIKIITIGEPKLAYAKLGWNEYIGRLKHYHKLEIIHLAERYAYDSGKILSASNESYRIVTEVNGRTIGSQELSEFLRIKALESQDLTFIIGGPEGLPREVLDKSDMLLSLSKLTFPHDLAMLVLAEALYRASTISAGSPYHK